MPGDGFAAALLARRNDLGELRDRADAGDRHAAFRLARLLAERGDLDGAEQVLRAAADARRLGGLRGSGGVAATSMGYAPGPTPATGSPPRSWPPCWPDGTTSSPCASRPTPATSRLPGG